MKGIILAIESKAGLGGGDILYYPTIKWMNENGEEIITKSSIGFTSFLYKVGNSIDIVTNGMDQMWIEDGTVIFIEIMMFTIGLIGLIVTSL